jgi:hypothetical protein
MSDLDQNSKVGTSTDELSQRRRALLKGSAVAIPAILTLRSGSAFAATSLSCAAKTQKPNPVPVAASTLDDNWYRIQTKCRELTLVSSPSDPKITVFKKPNTSKWYNVNTDSSNVSVAFVQSGPISDRKMKSNNGTGAEYSYISTTDCNVLAQVNANGKITGVIGASASGFPFASDSCVASLNQGILP